VAPLDRIRARIVACDRCARLRTYCATVARDKKPAHRGETYWGRPVPGFGDAQARVVLLGLAPAAHGANRTGRVFTGDGPNGSGDFLMRALHDAGFANQPTSQHRDDGLQLTDMYILGAVRCAPPGNKPLPAEIEACASHLDAELTALRFLRVVVALGRIAHDAYWSHLKRRGMAAGSKPPFTHGAIYVPQQPAALLLVDTFHPSRQNTNTGRLTPVMLDQVFRTVRQALE
jgi:uracil-DNA glycosylase family 4